MASPDPPTQSAPTAPSQKLFYQDGKPLSIFVEPGGIHNRPRLVRRLLAAGATLSTDPKQAHIILVDPPTSQGRSFIRIWGGSPGVTVLDYRWATACLSNKQVQLADSDWGGYVAQDDGIGFEADNQEDAPKVTPVENHPTTAHVGAAPSTSKTKRHVSRPKSISPPAPSPSDDEEPDEELPPPPQSASTSTRAAQSPGLDSQPPSATQPQFNIPPNPWFPMMGSQPQPTGLPGVPGMPYDQAAFMMYMASMQNMNMGNPNFMNVLNDIVRLNPGVATQTPTPTVNQLPQPNTPSWPTKLPNPVAGPSSHHRRTDSYPSTAEPSPRYSTVASDDFNLKHDASTNHVDAPPPKRQKISGSSSVTSSVPSKRTTADSRHNRKIFTKADGNPSNFYVQIQLHNRAGVVGAIRKNGGTIVTEPKLADYAILSVNGHDYATLLSAAVQAGTPALKSAWVTDSVTQRELLDISGYEYHHPSASNRKRTTKASNSTIVKKEVTEDETLALLRRYDEEDQEKSRIKREEKAAKQRARREEAAREAAVATAAAAAAATAPSSVRAPATSGKQRVSTPGLPSPTVSAPVVPKIKIKLPSSTTGRHLRSPSPPPPKVLPSGRYKFTEEETEYVLEYVKVALARDHTASLSAIVNGICKRNPHHTPGSWRTHIGKYNAQIDEIRKRAGIEHRKRERAQEQSHSVSAALTSPVASTSAVYPAGAVLDLSQDDRHAQRLEPEPVQATETELSEELEKDLNTVAKFFAGPAASFGMEVEDDTIWAELTKISHCQTASSWKEFYIEHNVEVNRRYDLLAEAKSGVANA